MADKMVDEQTLLRDALLQMQAAQRKIDECGHWLVSAHLTHAIDLLRDKLESLHLSDGMRTGRESLN